MADATQAQLDARLNPEASSFQFPTEGLFRTTGDSGGTIYKMNADGTISAFDITSLLTEDQKKQAGSYGAQIQMAQQLLQSQYGFDITSLPEAGTLGDIVQQQGSKGIGSQNADGVITGVVNPSNSLSSFLGVSSAQLQTIQQNTQKNELGTPQATPQPLASATVNNTTYYKDPGSGAYYTIGATGPNPVTDQGTLTRLQSGDLASTEQPYTSAVGTGSASGGSGTSSDLTALSSALAQPGAKTVYLNGEQVNIDANGNIVSSTPYQGSTPPANGTIISSDYAPKTDAELAAANQSSTFAGGNANQDGQFTQEQQQQILQNQTPEEQAYFNSDAFKSLPQDQQDVIRNMYDLIAVNDQAKAEQLVNALDAATKIADPFFAQQLKLATDEFQRGFVSIQNDQAYQEQVLQNRLADLQNASSEQLNYLSLEQQRQLGDLQRKYEQDLLNTRQNMAARGFTFSTRRAQAENLLSANEASLVEGTNRQFGLQIQQTQDKLASGERDTAAELARLQQLGEQNKLDLARQAEATLGSTGAGALSNVTPLGNIQGSIAQNKASDILNSVNNLIF